MAWTDCADSDRPIYTWDEEAQLDHYTKRAVRSIKYGCGRDNEAEEMIDLLNEKDDENNRAY
jgi:hypothetical protein